MRNIILAIALFLSLPVTAADVYKYTDEKGIVHYTDKPPSKNAKPANLPPLHTYSPAPMGGLSAPTPSTPGAAEVAPIKYELRITSPEPDQTNRDASGNLAVTVVVTPDLPDGYTLVYYADDQANGEPRTTTSATLSGLARGQHSIVVALIDKTGAEVTRSAAVAVNLRQPTVKAPVAAPRPAPR
ncbi:DUF4124 domain-containing protein [Solimonas sp. K1W22B-7]|uniref:DUF4124 domain-containing protein n=1 Tax=Solimonas sp. K1W22B-7 TaxID=2303331 RepID=UPI000E32F6EA|nr:DUF4124 domain-containing protein [Solimonas sp. K1W22B-7]AXQ31326.1 DUF4124 domain-containing protein [Solimonas sp. K1W22B-7]